MVVVACGPSAYQEGGRNSIPKRKHRTNSEKTKMGLFTRKSSRQAPRRDSPERARVDRAATWPILENRTVGNTGGLTEKRAQMDGP